MDAKMPCSERVCPVILKHQSILRVCVCVCVCVAVCTCACMQRCTCVPNMYMYTCMYKWHLPGRLWSQCHHHDTTHAYFTIQRHERTNTTWLATVSLYLYTRPRECAQVTTPVRFPLETGPYVCINVWRSPHLMQVHSLWPSRSSESQISLDGFQCFSKSITQATDLSLG